MDPDICALRRCVNPSETGAAVSRNLAGSEARVPIFIGMPRTGIRYIYMDIWWPTTAFSPLLTAGRHMTVAHRSTSWYMPKHNGVS